MALKGHGDPRWIVSDRTDGKNVNNWHWTETDLSSLAKDKFTEYLKEITVETSDISVKTSTVTCKGDVSVNTRKQKTFVFYELDVTLKWEGKLLSTGTTGSGTVHMPYISEENDMDDFEVKITTEGESNDLHKLKEALKAKIVPILREKVPLVLTDLKDIALGHTKLPEKKANTTTNIDKVVSGVTPIEAILSTSSPTTTPPVPRQEPTTPTPTPTATPSVPTPDTTPKTAAKSKGVRTVSITLGEKFVCKPMDLYYCLTDVNRVRAYAGSDATVTSSVGGKFSIFGGAITGEFTQLEAPNKIVQKWRSNEWPENHFSEVTIELSEKNGKTVLKLTQMGIPVEDKERTEAGWSNNYIRRIKAVFGFGSLA